MVCISCVDSINNNIRKWHQHYFPFVHSFSGATGDVQICLGLVSAFKCSHELELQPGMILQQTTINQWLINMYEESNLCFVFADNLGKTWNLWWKSIRWGKKIKTLLFKLFVWVTSSVESQKGAINIQRCSVENQKDAIAVQSLWW